VLVPCKPLLLTLEVVLSEVAYFGRVGYSKGAYLNKNLPRQ